MSKIWSSFIASKPAVIATTVTVTATSAILIWYNMVKTTFKNVAEVASQTDFAITIVEPEEGIYALGYKEKTEEEEANGNQTENNTTTNTANTTAEDTNTIDSNTVNNTTNRAQAQQKEILYTTKDEVIEAIAKKLKSDGIEAKAMHLDAASGYIQKFIEAEITTNYPNLSHSYSDVVKTGSGEEADKTAEEWLNLWKASGLLGWTEWTESIQKLQNEAKEANSMKYLQGIVHVIRRGAEAEDSDLGQYLQYIPYGDEETEGTFKYMAEKDDPETLKYFSINEKDWSIYVATYKKVYGDEENSYTISVQSVPYKSVVSKYSVPFEFLVALMEVSSTPEWAEKVADMVLEGSRIELVMQDCLTITKKEVTHSYDQVTETKDEDGQVHRTVTSHSSTSVTTTEQNTITSYVREVETWIVNVKQNCEKKVEGPNTGTSVQELENSDYYDNGTTSGHKENRKITTVTTTTKISYQVGVSMTNESGTVSGGIQDHLLFIGDSWGAGAKSLIDSTFPGSINISKGGSYAKDGSDASSDWLSSSMYSQATGKTGMKAIYIELGINGPDWNKDGIPALADKLRESYPDLPIYIQKCFNISSKMNGDAQQATAHNQKIDQLNTVLEQYCSSHDNVYFVDTTTDMIESGHLKDSLSNLGEGGDGFHLNEEGKKKWIENMKQVLGGTTSLSDSATKGISQEIPADVRSSMQGKSMVDNNNVSFEDLRYLTIPYINFSGQRAVGHMVVHKDVAEDTLAIFEELYNIKYPIEKMELVDKYYQGTRSDMDDHGSDYRSIEANNTSAFNYRRSTDTGNVSMHGMGKAIDLNPQINPYVKSDGTGSHENARKYWDRSESNRNSLPSPQKEAFITKNTEVYKIFTNHGWTWLGDTSYNDTQHFEKR